MTYLILGLARSGKATAHFLSDHQIATILFDDNGSTDTHSNVMMHCNDIPWDEITCVIQSPGIAYLHPAPHAVTAAAMARNIPICSDIDLFQKYRPAHTKCIGITGTNGKSTTTALVTHILNASGIKAAMGGNIGVPALSLLRDDKDQTGDLLNDQKGKQANSNVIDCYVLELSSYQLETTQRIDLDVAALLNITEDHIDRHGNMDGYIAAKKRIFRNATCVIDTDVTDDAAASIDFTHNPYLPGTHNAQNCRFAYRICAAIGLTHDQIMAGITSFHGLEHRMELVYTCKDFCIVNDSKATNADSAEKALAYYLGNVEQSEIAQSETKQSEITKTKTAQSDTALLGTAPLDAPLLDAIQSDVYWIAGGVAKEGGITSLSTYFPKLAHAYVFGTAAHAFAQTIGDATITETLADAIDAAFADIRKTARTKGYTPGRRYVLLFSPACASFDQFTDFEHRGRVFKEHVQQRLAERRKEKADSNAAQQARAQSDTGQSDTGQSGTAQSSEQRTSTQHIETTTSKPAHT